MITALNILGDITSKPKRKEDVSVGMVIEQIGSLNKGDKLEVNINTYGGEIFEAVAMRGIIANCPAIKCFNILGLCASAANVLFDSTDDVRIAKGAMVMNHWAQGEANGDSREHRRVAKLLDKIDREIILGNLGTRSAMDTEELTLLLNDEWWLSSDEAIQILGFSDAGISAIENRYQTSQIGVYKNFLEKKKALSGNAYHRFINIKNSLK